MSPVIYMSTLTDINLNNYANIFKQANDITPQSKITYTNTIKAILKKFDTNNLIDILNDPAKYSKLIHREENIRTQKTYFTAILAFFKHANLKENFKELFTKWYDCATAVSLKVTDLEYSHVATEKQMKGIIPWYDIIAARDKLDIGSIDHLLLTIYTTLTRRQADYFRVYIYSNVNEVVDENITYINLTPTDKTKKPYIHITVGKTIKSGVFEDVLSQLFIQSLKISLVKQPRKYLFVDSSGKPYSNTNSFQKWCNGRLKSILNNAYVSVNMLRHSHAQHFNLIPNLTYAERLTMAKKMGHSVQKQLTYDLSPSLMPKMKSNTTDVTTYDKAHEKQYICLDDLDDTLREYIRNKVYKNIIKTSSLEPKNNI